MRDIATKSNVSLVYKILFNSTSYGVPDLILPFEIVYEPAPLSV